MLKKFSDRKLHFWNYCHISQWPMSKILLQFVSSCPLWFFFFPDSLPPACSAVRPCPVHQWWVLAVCMTSVQTAVIIAAPTANMWKVLVLGPASYQVGVIMLCDVSSLPSIAHGWSARPIYMWWIDQLAYGKNYNFLHHWPLGYLNGIFKLI